MAKQDADTWLWMAISYSKSDFWLIVDLQQVGSTNLLITQYKLFFKVSSPFLPYVWPWDLIKQIKLKSPHRIVQLVLGEIKVTYSSIYYFYWLVFYTNKNHLICSLWMLLSWWGLAYYLVSSFQLSCVCNSIWVCFTEAYLFLPCSTCDPGTFIYLTEYV